MIITDWIQAISMVVLVLVTIYYAWQTSRTVCELRLQRLASKPVVIPDIDIHFGQKDFTEKMEDIVQSDFPVVLTNVGTAAAIELKLLLMIPSKPVVTVIPSKLPLLPAGASWRRNLSYYVQDFTQEGEPKFGMSPPEGRYELRVTFKSDAHHQESQGWEFSLPFDLHLPHGNIGLSIIRGELCEKPLGGNHV